MDYTEFRKIVLEKAKEKNLSKEELIRLRTELFHAKTYYDDVGDLYEDLHNKPVKTKVGILPYIFGITDSCDLNNPLDLVQVKPGASGGIDVDSDFSGAGRERVIAYLKTKYGEDCVTPVGTVSSLQMKVACKDLLRYAAASVADSNAFTAELNDELSFEDNLNNIKNGSTPAKEVYDKYSKILDMVPRFLGKARNYGCHAGGIVITPKPIWNYCPVERSSDTIVTAFPENGSNSVLDDLGIIKLDLLAISVLDVIKETFDLIDEELYLIEEDGIQKIVPESYIREQKNKLII